MFTSMLDRAAGAAGALLIASALLSAPAAAGGIDHIQAVDLALDAVPQGVPVEVEDKRFDGKAKFEVKLVRDDGRVLYKVDLDAQTGAVRRIRDIAQDAGRRVEWLALIDRVPQLELTLSDALAEAYGRYPNAAIIEVELDLEHGQLFYDITLRDGNNEIELKINGEDGNVNDPGGGGGLSFRQAMNLARSILNRGDLMKIEIEREHGNYIYHTETVIRNGRKLIELDLDEDNGAVMSRDTRACDAEERNDYREILALLPTARIDFAGALNRVLNAAGNACAVEIEFEEEHGVLYYKVKIRNVDGTRTIYLVNATTGEVTEE